MKKATSETRTSDESPNDNCMKQLLGIEVLFYTNRLEDVELKNYIYHNALREGPEKQEV